LGFEIQASLISAGVNDPVRVTGDGIPAHYDITVGIDLGAVDFHCREFSWVSSFGF
jgi:hypothetical protein